MFKKIMVMLGAVALIGSLAVAAPTIFPTGTTIYFPNEAYSSYILISDHNDMSNHPDALVRTQGKVPDDVRLIDMNGNVVHSWKVDPYFNKRSRLQPNGNLVTVGQNRTIIEYDWDGNVVWKHEGIGSVNDLRVLANGNKLLIAHEPMPAEYQARVNDQPSTQWWGEKKRGTEETQLSGNLYEVNAAGDVVWEWKAYEHLDLNRFSPATPPGDWLHANSMAELPENKWYDAGDTRFKPGNILFNARNINAMFIIDKQSGEVVWEGTHDYKGGMSHSHEPEMIEKGLPGEGNIILFDNGLFTTQRIHTGQTYIVEINPVNQEVVWVYETLGYANLKFFSKSMGSQKRLPNGNTYIAEDNTGRLFQVTPDKKIVWEFVNRGGTTRPSIIPYDFTPQLRAMKKPEELSVTPPNNLEWQLKPDSLR